MLASLVGGTRLAHAASTRVVIVTVAPTSAEGRLDTQVRPALEGQLRELGVEVVALASEHLALSFRARRAPKIAASAGALGVIWLDQKPHSVGVYLYDATGRHLYVREAELGGSQASVAEEIAIVLRSAIGALLEGNMIGMTEVKLPPSPPERVAEPPTAQASRTADAPSLRIGVGYLGTLFSRNAAFQHGATAAIALGLPRSPFYAGLAYTYLPPLRLSGEGVRGELQRHPGEVFAGAELRFTPIYITAEGAVIGDAVARTTVVEAPDITATAPATRWLWALSTRLGCAVPLRTGLRLRLAIGAEFLLNRFDQVIDGPDARREVAASPLLARPRVEAGITVEL